MFKLKYIFYIIVIKFILIVFGQQSITSINNKLKYYIMQYMLINCYNYYKYLLTIFI